MAQLTEKQFVDRLVKWVAIGDGSVWPAADECMDRLEWELRYGDPVRARYVAASVVAAYRQLFKTTGKKRIQVVRAIRGASMDEERCCRRLMENQV